MERKDFLEVLSKEGFEEVVTVTREANGFLDSHTHAFEAKALILTGELRIWAEGSEHLFQAGQVFHLPANAPHAEQYGPDGVEYLVGRK